MFRIVFQIGAGRDDHAKIIPWSEFPLLWKRKVMKGFEQPQGKYFKILQDLLDTALASPEWNFSSHIEIQRVQFDFRKGYLVADISIPRKWLHFTASELLHRLRDSIDNEGPDLWMEGDIGIEGEDEVDFAPVFAKKNTTRDSPDILEHIKDK